MVLDVSMILTVSMILVVVVAFVVVFVNVGGTGVPYSTAPLKGGRCLWSFRTHPWSLGVVFVLVLNAPLKVGSCLHSSPGTEEESLSLELVAPRFCFPQGFVPQGKLGRRR